MLFGLSEESTSEVESFTCWVYQEEFTYETLASGEAQGLFFG